MYIPRSFAEPETAVLHAFIEAHSFATLVTASDGLFASHLPLILRSGDGPLGTLEGHIARANPHRSRVPEQAPALVIFTGPQAHVTPTWYPSRQTDGRVVPTWNYVAVHAYGNVRFTDDTEFLRGHLGRLVARHEGARGSDWTIDDPPEEYVSQQLRAIVGVEIIIAQLEGKWKMSQNRSEADRDGVVDGLRHSGSEQDSAVAALVAQRLAHDQGA